MRQKKINELLSSFADPDRVDTVVYYMIDRIVHNTLRMFEESGEFTISSKDKEEDIVEASDGLSGELYGENGWIAKYSSSKTE